MTGKQRIIHALERKPFLQGMHVPHFELVFFLTMEEFGRVHPLHRRYDQWTQMTERERDLQRSDMADCFIQTARRFNHDAIFVHNNPGTIAEAIKIMTKIREKSGDEFFLMMHGDPTFSIPDGDMMVDFSVAMAEEPEKLKKEAQERVDQAIRDAESLARNPGLLDGFALCSDYCFNVAPFFSPLQFSEFVAPYLAQTVRAYRELGFYTIKHTDGNIMPILDQLVQANPHALHSIDPQAGVSLAGIKKTFGDRVCLIGNVNCGLLQTGTREEVVADIRRSLREGMSDGQGYIFSTSNCIYTGMDLERYHLMHRLWRAEGQY
ncbi:MAG TPA: hypothetical protein DD640_07670 [Clostridiales bacterium]|nr:hypothetical protein [Clostridiales bacterium]